jgi:hypothetical protein
VGGHARHPAIGRARRLIRRVRRGGAESRSNRGDSAIAHHCR